MVSESGFAGGDQEYLRDVQYCDGAKLAARANLHIKYGTAATPWFVWVVNQLGWPRAAEVLEVGCGPGWLWVEATLELPSDLELTLTDLSTGMVNEAVARVGESGRFRIIQARVADAQELPFEDASFDVAVANHMLYHVPDPGRAVAELRGSSARLGPSLRPPTGGAISLSCGRSEPRCSMCRPFLRRPSGLDARVASGFSAAGSALWHGMTTRTSWFARIQRT